MALRKVTCALCGNEFETEKNAKHYCSVKCRRRAQAKRDKERRGLRTFTCAWCGNEFLSTRKRKYCKADCRLMANGKILPRTKKTEKPKMTIEQIAKASREEGLSYGEYVRKYRL